MVLRLLALTIGLLLRERLLLMCVFSDFSGALNLLLYLLALFPWLA